MNDSRMNLMKAKLTEDAIIKFDELEVKYKGYQSDFVLQIYEVLSTRANGNVNITRCYLSDSEHFALFSISHQTKNFNFEKFDLIKLNDIFPKISQRDFQKYYLIHDPVLENKFNQQIGEPIFSKRSTEEIEGERLSKAKEREERIEQAKENAKRMEEYRKIINKKKEEESNKNDNINQIQRNNINQNNINQNNINQTPRNNQTNTSNLNSTNKNTSTNQINQSNINNQSNFSNRTQTTTNAHHAQSNKSTRGEITPIPRTGVLQIHTQNNINQTHNINHNNNTQKRQPEFNMKEKNSNDNSSKENLNSNSISNINSYKIQLSTKLTKF